MGMKIGTATIENSMEFPQKIKNRVIMTQQPFLCVSTPQIENILRDMCTPVFVALFTVAKTWKQLKCLHIYGEYLYIYSGTLLSHRKR